jgi:hypothetical protein
MARQLQLSELKYAELQIKFEEFKNANDKAYKDLFEQGKANKEKFEIGKAKEIADLKSKFEEIENDRQIDYEETKDKLDILNAEFDLYKADVVRMMTKIDDFVITLRNRAFQCSIEYDRNDFDELSNKLFNIVNPALGIEMQKQYNKIYDKNELKIQIEKSVIEIRSLIEDCGGCGTIKINIYSETDNLLKLLI